MEALIRCRSAVTGAAVAATRPFRSNATCDSNPWQVVHLLQGLSRCYGRGENSRSANISYDFHSKDNLRGWLGALDKADGSWEVLWIGPGQRAANKANNRREGGESINMIGGYPRGV